MEYTQNYKLPLWDKDDSVKRTDFNENSQKIETAIQAAEQTAAQAVSEAKQTAAADLAAEVINRESAVAAVETALAAETATRKSAVTALQAAMPKVATGVYTGNSDSSSTSYQTQEIDLGFQPKAVFVSRSGDIVSSNNGVFFTAEKPFMRYEKPVAAVTETGFLVGVVYYGELVSPALNYCGMQYSYLAIG